jgi:arylsulfatase A-like enzyme
MKKAISRRNFLKTTSMGAAALSATSAIGIGCSSKTPEPQLKPNIIYILADDLGYGELGCYGQEKIKTPNLDRLAQEGMKFTQHYSGSPVCAPSRCVLLTGKHTGHAYIRGNDEMGHRGDVWRDLSLEGQRPLVADEVTFPELLQKQGYVTGAIGKWGLGAVGSEGDPNKQGFDFFYGYTCQRVAHNFYPVHLWKNDEKIPLEGNDIAYPHIKLPEDKDPNDPESYKPYTGKHYSVDLMSVETGNFIQENRNKPFFLYLPFTIPHVSLQSTPEDLKELASPRGFEPLLPA